MSSSPLSRPRPDSTFITHPLAWLLVWAVAHVLSRQWISPALELDEAQQMLWTQQLSLGYGPQPPLYSWLQWLVNGVLGPNLWSLSVLKVSLLALTFAFVWKASRELLPPHAAWWASAGMVWLPLMGWESLRDLTHSVLVTCMVTATWWLTLRLIKRPSSAAFASLGLAIGLGVLSKYSFALFAVALGGAALSLREPRRALLSPGWWWLPLTAALTVAPHAGWLLEHWAQASHSTLNKLQVQVQPSAWSGLLSMVTAIASNLLLWAGMALAVFGRAWWRPTDKSDTPTAPEWVKPLFTRYLLLVLCCLLAMVFVGHVSHFKGRWIHPLVCTVPLMAFVWRPQLATHPRGRFYTWGVVVLAVLFWVLATARPWLNARSGRVNQINEPIAALSQAIAQHGFNGLGTVLVNDEVLAGMLRTRFPQARVVNCPEPFQAEAPDCSPNAPHFTKGVLRVVRGTTSAVHWNPDWPVQTVQAPYLYAAPGAEPITYRFQWQKASTP